MSLWKDVDGYEGLYIVSDEGEVISLPGWSKTACGYEWRYEGSEDLSL